MRGWVGVGEGVSVGDGVGVEDGVCVGGLVGVADGTGVYVGVSVEVAVRVGSSVKVGEGKLPSTLWVSRGGAANAGAPSPIVASNGGRVGIESQEEVSVNIKTKPVRISPFFMEIVFRTCPRSFIDRSSFLLRHAVYALPVKGIECKKFANPSIRLRTDLPPSKGSNRYPRIIDGEPGVIILRLEQLDCSNTLFWFHLK